MSPLQLTTGTSRTGQVYRYMKCAKKVNTGECPGGDAVSISEIQLDILVMNQLVEELLTPERVREVAGRALEMQVQSRGEASARISALKKHLAVARRKEANLWDLAATESLGARAGFREKLDAVEEEIASLSRQIVVQQEMLDATVKPLTKRECEEKAQQMRRLLLTAPISDRRRFVHSVVERVIVDNKTITVVGQESTLAEVASGTNISTPPRFVVLPGSGAG